MSNVDYRKIFAIREQNKRKVLELCDKATTSAGIYVFLRTDENGIKYFYVGQAVNLIERLAGHLSFYSGLRSKNIQWIDASIKKHGLYNCDKKPNGWRIEICAYCHCEKLNDLEVEFVAKYMGLGYQSRNATTGSQGSGKKEITDRSRVGYMSGKNAGIEKAEKHIITTLAKYFDTEPKKCAYVGKRLRKDADELLQKINAEKDLQID